VLRGILESVHARGCPVAGDRKAGDVIRTPGNLRSIMPVESVFESSQLSERGFTHSPLPHPASPLNHTQSVSALWMQRVRLPSCITTGLLLDSRGQGQLRGDKSVT